MNKKANSSGLKENWIEEENSHALHIKVEKSFGKTKMDEIGRNYDRIPHPTLKNTFILRRKK